MARANKHGDGLGQAPAASGEEREGLDKRIHDLDFAVRKSRRYHEKFCAFYSVWRDWMKIVTVISGSGIFFLLFADAKGSAEIIAAFVAVWAGIDYIVGPDKKAELHRSLCQQFIDLAAKIETMKRTEEAYRPLAAARLKIEKNEPPVKRLVDLQARNDECRARNYSPDNLVPLSAAQRWLGYVVTFGLPRLGRWKADRQRQEAA